jgi:dTDP-4-amino-4,6-dideoxygalactose transaminase
MKSDTANVKYRIPFNRASCVGNEFEYIRQALESGQISGDGDFTRRCNALLERELGVAKVLLTTSCTHALEMAALLLDIQPGDEVIVPSFTFVSTANAFVLRGARPRFCDNRPDTLNLDEGKIEPLITERTKAVVPVHYAGIGCEMDCILRIAQRHGICVVEDNAHGLFGKFRGKYLGTFGCLATQSFHETKNFTCGEGGALLINDFRYLDRAEILREKGTNRSRFFRGEIDKYSWVDVGSSYLPSEILAAFLFAQLERRGHIQSQRQHIWTYYAENLKAWAKQNDIRLPCVPGHCDQAYHMFYLLLPSLDVRQALIRHLRVNDILAVFHYLPLHLSEMARRWGGKPGDCPVAESISDRLLRLPFYTQLSDVDLSRIVSVLLAFNV